MGADVPLKPRAAGGVAAMLRRERALLVGIVTTALFYGFGDALIGDLSDLLRSGLLFTWLFAVMLWMAFAVVRHADALAFMLGEPYGTLILTLAVISIEVAVIVAVMLTGENNPTLARDTMFSVLMIVLNGLVGLALLVGALRHIEQSYNLAGAHTFLVVIIPLAGLGLILPRFTQSTADATLTYPQEVFLMVATIMLYSVFLSVQTMRHRGYFVQPDSGEGNADDHDHHGQDVIAGSITFHAILLVATMLPIVLLSKPLGLYVNFGIEQLRAPAPLGGFLVAILVLSPEGLAALKAAMQDQLQRSINICFGSALATIGLTIPAVLIIDLFTERRVALGLEAPEIVLLALTLLLCIRTFGAARTNALFGLVHLVLFFAYVLLIFD